MPIITVMSGLLYLNSILYSNIISEIGLRPYGAILDAAVERTELIYYLWEEKKRNKMFRAYCILVACFMVIDQGLKI